MTDERKEAILNALPGRVEYMEIQLAELTGQLGSQSELLKRVFMTIAKDALASEIANVTPLSSNSNVNTLTEDIRLTEDIGVLQFINPNGGARTVRLPRVGVSNKYYIVVNTATP